MGLISKTTLEIFKFGTKHCKDTSWVLFTMDTFVLKYVAGTFRIDLVQKLVFWSELESHLSDAF